MGGDSKRRWWEGGYVALVGLLAAVGAVRADSHYLLAAVVLTLPCGVAALLAVYGGYALLAGVGGLWAASTLPDGSDAAWLTAGSAVVDIVALLAAALANVLIFERRARRPSLR
ncbi:hypothetical protein ACIQGZ_28720 [Streptomyces sp. NPDC092296]|uniref:hypothetical protein n=1 Tax=Streptomyces sp. NPDC092296 TaxID=3366012 RepID=UPI00380BEE77